MDDVFDVLAQDHEDVRQMLAELEKGPTEATGASDAQLMLRTIMTERRRARRPAGDAAWTSGLVTCDPVDMSVTDPLLVVRRHVDFLRVRSAICRLAR